MRIEGEVYEVFNFLRGVTLPALPDPPSGGAIVEEIGPNDYVFLGNAKPARKAARRKGKRAKLDAGALAAAYAKGASTTALGREHGVSASSIRAAVLRAGGKMRPGTRGKRKAGRKRKATA